MSHDTLQEATRSVEDLPGEDDLITDDGEPMETQRHVLQMNLLIETLLHHWRDRNDFFCTGNMFVYFSAAQIKRNDFRGPDFFVVMHTERRERKAWVAWNEGGQLPDVVVELLSDSTREVDRGEKKRIYEQVWKVMEYLLYDPWTGELEAYRLTPTGYEPLPAVEGRYPSEKLGLSFGTWRGEYMGVEATWLRLFADKGDPLPTPWEAADAEAVRAGNEAARAEKEAARAESEAARAESEAARARELQKKLQEYERRFGPLPSEA